jgi:ribosome biogenesis protein MAK21
MAKGSKPTATASGANAKTLGKRKQVNGQGNVSFDVLRSHIEAKLNDGGSKAQSQTPRGQEDERQQAKSAQSRGKKRDRSGKVLTSKATDSDVPVAGGNENGDDTRFEDEVRALGGSNEDIEFLAEVDSDSEVEGTEDVASTDTKKGKANLTKGMSNILKEIALAQGQEAEPEPSSDEESADEPEEDVEKPASLKATKKKLMAGLRCEPRPDWYTPILSVPTTSSAQDAVPSSDGLVRLKAFAEQLLEQENSSYREKHQSGASRNFYNTVITSGTLSDKISALTLAVQESPIHNKQALESLFSMSKKRSRTQAIDVLRALKDLMAQSTLLPDSRRLYSFSTQPKLLRTVKHLRNWREGDKLPKGITEEYLIPWAFESWLKEQYFEMLQTLETWSNDEIEFSKSRSLSYVYELLKERPEQEANLLRLLINKLGDPVKKIASQASYLIMQLLTAHPAMKSIVISAIETDFIFRPGQAMHGKYYAVVTLNQTPLTANEEDMAHKLLGIYFGLFSALLKAGQPSTTEDANAPKSTTRGERQRKQHKKPVENLQSQDEELREKLTSALLTGVNRAYPYADAEHKSFDAQIDTLFTIAHSANFNTSVQAMLLIQQLSASHQPSNDRFYRVLYESLLDPRLITASKQQMYLNLLHRALKADLNTRRVKAFVKRILQILSLHEPSFICGAFFLLKDLEPSFPGLTSLIDQPEEGDEEEEVFKDVDNERQHQRPSSDINGANHPMRYDGHKRAPEHANADRSCAWEVSAFLAHFHPSVVASADHYIRHVALPGKPDLNLHTLIHFLDRFVYRNAKISETKMRGTSVMQPLASDNTRAVLLNPTAGGLQGLPVNSEAFRAKKDSEVAAEDVFFHHYFATLGKNAKKDKKKKGKSGDDESDDEDAVWKAMLDTAPELEVADESDEDVDMSDFEAAMGSDVSEHDQQDDASEGGVDVEAGIFSDEEADTASQIGSAGVPDLDSDDESEEDEPKPVKENRRKKLKSLPTFASVDDYAKMLEDEEDEDFGQ